MKPTLVIMAAGLGSRYGGAKQIDALGPAGESIMEYSLFDAARAGFGRAVFVVREEMRPLVEQTAGNRACKHMEVFYAAQDLEKRLPVGARVPAGRTKPWGTAHAALCAAPYVDGPFCVVNADDYYGPRTFTAMAEFLCQPAAGAKMRIAMAGFALKNTLTENGTVSRGVCQIDKAGNLQSITERTEIQAFPDGVKFREGKTWIPLPEDTVVSMNCWGFPADFMAELESGFGEFLSRLDDPMKSEYYLPAAVDRLLRADRAFVRVLPTPEKWFGVTYKEDRAPVQAALEALAEETGGSPRLHWA